MIALNDIKKAYPSDLHIFDSFLLREYLQYRILGIIFSSSFAERLVFLGGTCLRIVHGNRRFSEDLDFDNLDLSKEEFKQLGELVQNELELEGYTVSVDQSGQAAYRCNVRLPGLLYRHGLSGHRDQSILIQLDSEAQHYDYKPVPYFLSKWDVRQDICCCPLPLLMSQKCHAIINRKRAKGRDFFDMSFLLGLNIQPDLNYINLKLNLSSLSELSEALLARCSQLDMEEMADDVQSFLFDTNGRLGVTRFAQLLQQSWNTG